MGRQQPTHVMKGLSLAALVLVVLSANKALSAPQQEQDPWLQVLNGGVEAEVRQDVANVEEGAQPVSQSQPQAPVQPPPRPQQFQQPQRPLQRPPPRRPGPQRFPQGPPRRRPTRRPGRRTTTSKGILGSAVDAVNAAVGGVGERLSCTGTNILTEAKLRDEAFIKFQLDCAMNVGPCDEIGEKIKILAPEVLAGRCPRPCNECTKTQIKRVMAELSQRFPRRFQEMMRQLAPQRG